METAMHDKSLVPVVETERLVLRGHRLSDFADCAAMWADPKVVAHISGVPSTPDQSWSRMMRYAGFWHHLGFGYWAVEAKADGAFLGEVGFADFHRATDPPLAGKPEAGWVFRTSAHGKGIATEAVRAMVAWADENLTHPVTCAMFDPAHEASVRVARKVGFTREIAGSLAEAEVLIMERDRPARV